MVNLDIVIQTAQNKSGQYYPVVEYMQHGRRIALLEYAKDTFQTRIEAYTFIYNKMGIDNPERIHNNIQQEVTK